ncbi:molybdopterin-dependent oxidoreductase [Usitatibacter palustris]|uniref:Assimilatory nitrate reductase catalytic subunit n=1 Tax=Usitatibacter palustris TaxID=2732487 RepID=A0A6M4H738_9PROT|nr:molybdopterin-dependent oxidoreductase [Usitatibacter palustris]QJR15340.1 Assimilatory nitrate reductase catalytic subunit [Usitatibacter palustris]
MDGSSPQDRVTHRACHLCEALCGLEIRTRGDQVVGVRGDVQDTFSRGHICPKAVALIDVHHDPDRLTEPVRREGDQWVPIGWDEAFELVATRFAAIQREHGANALGIYLGNPNAHHVGSILHAPAMIRALQTRNRFSATSVDQLPHHVVAYAMYGHYFMLPIPDIDHTAYWLILGANPLASNGSLMSAPDVAKRLKAVGDRGGKVVVIDPVRTETAEVATRHHFIKPGTDAAFLIALVNAVLELGPPRVERYGDQLSGLDTALEAIRAFGVEGAAAPTGIPVEAIRTIASEIHSAPSAVAYGRIGLSTQPFGTTCQWLIQILNLITGNLDRVGGAMPTLPAVALTGPGTRPGGPGSFKSRVSQHPVFSGELPVAAMSEEIDTAGEGRIRAMLTIAGNPVSSTPNGRRVDRALDSLEFMAAIDIYVNETTRHADVILPPASMLSHENYDVVFNALAIRNVARLNAPVFAKPEGALYDWEIYNGLGAAYAKATGTAFKAMPAPSVVLDGALRAGPYGKTLSIAALQAAPHGVDLGALAPSLLERLETPDKKIACAPEAFVADLARVRREIIDAAATSELRLVGRRHLRSNNSWMHNAHRLTKGPRRDQLWIHPDDAAKRGIVDGNEVTLASRVGCIQVTAKVCDRVMPGVVCLPHGFGQAREGVRLATATALAGASYNDVADETALDPVSGNAALNALPVTVSPVTSR